MSAKSKKQSVARVATMNAVAGAMLAIYNTPSLANVQTYNSANGVGALVADHPGDGFYQNDGSFDEGLGLVDFGYAGAANGFTQDMHALLDFGYTGRTGDHSAESIINYSGTSPNPPLQPQFWFAGLGNDSGPIPSLTPSNVLAYADVIAPVGKPFQFKILSAYTGVDNGFIFSGVGVGTWQTVGGAISGSQPTGAFDPADQHISLVVNYTDEINSWDAGPGGPSVLRIDNLTMTISAASWNTASSGNWSDGTRWTGGFAPDGADAVATFGAGTPPPLVTVDGQRFAGTVRFNNASSYTVGGTGPLTIRTVTSSGGFDVQNGNHTVSAPVELWSNTTYTVTPAGSVLTLSGPITALTGVNVTKAGAGRADVSNANAAALTVNAGTLKVLANGTVAGKSKVSSLTIAGGATPTAKLDVTNNALVVDYNSPTPSPLATIAAQIKSAFAGGAWTGNGITSSSANASTYGIGYAERSALGTVPSIFGTVDADAVLVRSTRYGDANLDGIVNSNDFSRLASNFGLTGKGWFDGDFNYDGTVNSTDFSRLASNFGLAATGANGEVTPEDWANLAAAVPEPTAFAILGVAASAAMLRTRRRRA